MIKNYNNINEIQQDLSVNKERKELYGEVFTPFILINKIITLISNDNFQNENNKWLDIGAGSGYFSIYLYFKLFENLKKKFINEDECKDYIIENMIFMCEIQENNCEQLREIFGKKANIINDDYINYNFDNYKIKEFDYIIGNPPFNCNGMKNRHPVPLKDAGEGTEFVQMSFFKRWRWRRRVFGTENAGANEEWWGGINGDGVAEALLSEEDRETAIITNIGGSKGKEINPSPLSSRSGDASSSETTISSVVVLILNIYLIHMEITLINWRSTLFLY